MSVKKVINYLFLGISWGCTFDCINLPNGHPISAVRFFSSIVNNFHSRPWVPYLYIACGSTSIVYRIDRLSLGIQILIHFTLGMSGYFLAAFYLGWIPLENKWYMMTFIILGFFLRQIRGIFLYKMKGKKEMNERLKESIGGTGKQMKYKLEKNVRDTAPVRNAFNALAMQTFQLSFEGWYENGCWSQRYQPYTLMDGATAAANVSVNLMKTRWNGQIKNYIQLGTVMTHPAYRNQGLSRYLIEEIFRDWEERCDGFYLFANETVLDFYPRFGFRRETEYQCSLPLAPSADGKRGKAFGWIWTLLPATACWKPITGCPIPFPLLPSLDNFNLLMFYCGSFLKDCVYYLPDYDAAAVAEQDVTSGTLPAGIFSVPRVTPCRKALSALLLQARKSGSGISAGWNPRQPSHTCLI